MYQPNNNNKNKRLLRKQHKMHNRDHNIINLVASFGFVQALKGLHKNGHPCDGTAFKYAVVNGHLDVLKILIDRKCHINKNYEWNMLSIYAAMFGHLHILKYLYEIGTRLNTQVFTAAVDYGDVDMLEWLHENNCTWDETIRMQAYIKNDNLVLQFLHDKGYMRNCNW